MSKAVIADNIKMVESEDLRKLIGKLKPCVKPGFDSLRNRHLKQMAGSKPEADPTEASFVDSLCEVINILLKGSEPPEVSSLLRQNELFACPKSNGDVRPIGIGFTYRKLTSMVLLHVTQEQFNDKHFGLLQCAMRRNGMEEIVHLIGTTLEIHPELDLFCADGDNAFNRANRIIGLHEVKSEFDTALPLLRNMYLQESQQWFFGLPDSIKPVICKNGYHQGDVLASWLYIMTIQPLLKQISDMVKEKHPGCISLVKFYVDDGNFVAPFEVMQDIIKLLKDPVTYDKYGYKLKMNKGCYLVGSLYGKVDEAKGRKQRLIDEFGFSPDIIKLHPDDGGVPESYGAQVLGAPIGTDAFIKQFLTGKLAELYSASQNLQNYPDLQGRYLMFRYCFSAKPVYLLRTIRPDLTQDFAVGFEALQKLIILSLLKCSSHLLTDLKYDWMCLGLSFGGLGIHKVQEVRHAAYCASVLVWLQSDSFYKEFTKVDRRKYFPNDHFWDLKSMAKLCANVDMEPNRWTSFFDCLQLFKFHEDPLVAIDLINKTKLRYRETLQSHLCKRLEDERVSRMEKEMDVTDLKWWVSQRNNMSGQPLQAFPSMECYVIRSSEFCTWLKYRYRIKMGHSNLKCTCKVATQVDDYGVHFSTGCNIDGMRTRIHDDLNRVVAQILRYSGYDVVLEETQLFCSLINDRNYRPDWTIKNPETLNLPGDVPFTSVIGDNTITCPLEGGGKGVLKPPTSRQAALKIADKAQERYREKFNGYVKKIQDLDPELSPPRYYIVPFVFQSTGLLHEKSMEFLERVADQAEILKKIPGVNILTFFMRRLAVCLAKNIAISINVKSSKMRSHYNLQYDRSFDDRIVMESGMNEDN